VFALRTPATNRKLAQPIPTNLKLAQRVTQRLAQPLAQFESTRTSMNPSANPSTPQSRPFPDGYDLEAERLALADLLEAEQPDESDPHWPRVVEFSERLRQLRQMQTAYRLRKGADAVVADSEAAVQAGGLIDDEPDAMVLHTKEAHRLFMGRARDPQGNTQPIVGGKRVAAALRSIWYLSGNDNPYADWALIDTGERIQQLKVALDELGQECEQRLQVAARKGLIFSILKSRGPVSLELGFRSPYGYSVAGLIVEFDYRVRQVKTLVRKDLMTDDEGRQRIREVTRKIRGVFETPVRFERYLIRQELRDLSRTDWLPGANSEAGKRVKAVTGIFGDLPKAVFTGDVAPRHSRRRVNLSEQELTLLQKVAEGALDGEFIGSADAGAGEGALL
jgi:integrating conjugative element protein (TIGR03761 family)